MQLGSSRRDPMTWSEIAPVSPPSIDQVVDQVVDQVIDQVIDQDVDQVIDQVSVQIPHGPWNTTTLIVVALDLSGVRCSLVLENAVNGDGFIAFVETVSTPTRQSGDVVAMDSLSNH